jgi:hypothetical protein
MTPVPTLNRDALTRALNGDRRLVAAFEQQAQAVTENQEATGLQVEATQALQDATVLTLSPNGALTNERVLKLGDGVRAIDDGIYLTLSVDDRFAHVAGGFRVDLTAEGDTAVVLPLGGVLATLGGEETLTNKTLNAAVLVAAILNASEYASDAAAAAGGVPVGGLYTKAGAVFRRSV